MLRRLKTPTAETSDSDNEGIPLGLNETVSADRIHIGFFGLRNAGKSSLVNVLDNTCVLKTGSLSKKYGKDEKDSGSVEVQVALLTEKITELTSTVIEEVEDKDILAVLK